MSTRASPPSRPRPAARPATYGSFTLDATGNWTYTADDSQTAIQQLGAGQSITDSFTAVSSDGTASQLVTVTIHGTNDVPVIGGASTGSVTEDVGACRAATWRPRARSASPMSTRASPTSRPRPDGGRQRLRHLHARCDRQLDLHRRRQPDGDPAARRRPVDHRQLHGGVVRRHGQPAGHGHHPRHQRRAGDRRRVDRRR